jgi:hypothetical protein
VILARKRLAAFQIRSNPREPVGTTPVSGRNHHNLDFGDLGASGGLRQGADQLAIALEVTGNPVADMSRPDAFFACAVEADIAGELRLGRGRKARLGEAQPSMGVGLT